MGKKTISEPLKVRDVMIVLVIFLAPLVSAYAGAEIRASAHWPKNGDRVTKTHYEYLEMPIDTTAWDFSGAIGTDDCHDMMWFNIGDSVIVRIENGSQSVLMFRNDSLLFDKYESALLGLRAPEPPLVFDGRLPLAGDSITSPCRFLGRFSGYNAIEFNGVITTKTLASGTLILPGDTVNDVTRIRYIIDGTLNASPDNGNIDENDGEPPLRLTVVRDLWYSESFRYELVENLSMRYFKKVLC